MGIRYISYLLDISLKMLERMQHFLRFWASYSITWPRCKRSFVSDNWCLVWTWSAFPPRFLSCKQSDGERKDFVDIPEQGSSWFYTSLRLFVSFVILYVRSLSLPCTLIIPDIYPRRFWWPLLWATATQSCLLAYKGDPECLRFLSPKGFSLQPCLPWDLWAFRM